VRTHRARMNKSRDCLPFYDCLMCRLYYIVNGGEHRTIYHVDVARFLPSSPTTTPWLLQWKRHLYMYRPHTHTHRPFVLTVCVCEPPPDVIVLMFPCSLCVCVCVIDPPVGKEKVESFLFYFQSKKHPQLGLLSIVPPRVCVCVLERPVIQICRWKVCPGSSFFSFFYFYNVHDETSKVMAVDYD
jgi:hypothetical protein